MVKMVFKKGHGYYPRKDKKLAQLGTQEISYEDIKEEEKPSEETERIINKAPDSISQVIGSMFYIEGKYEDWQKDINGNRIKFTRFYPGVKLYIDLFQVEKTIDEINNRKNLVEQHGGKYLPVKINEALTMESVHQALKGG